MARWNSTQIISPFPENIDRIYFGAWLSGFVDGEGCFRLSCTPRKRSPLYPALTGSFEIGQRVDDARVLQLIQSYFNCGRIYIDKKYYTKFVAAPKATYRVVNPSELANIIIPHFEKYSLLAKKRNDFAIWKKGVAMLYAVFLRPMKTSALPGRHGRLPKWQEEEKEAFVALLKELSDQRAYDPSILVNFSS